MTKLHVGNLSSEVTNDGLRQLFSDRGYLITSARVICDREGGRSRGFGFVELVKHARPHEPRDGRAESGRSRAAADTRVG